MRQGHFSVCKQFYSFFSRSVSFITHETRRMEAACARDIGLMRVFPVRQGWRTLPPEATLTPARPVPWGRAGVRANEPPRAGGCVAGHLQRLQAPAPCMNALFMALRAVPLVGYTIPLAPSFPRHARRPSRRPAAA